MRVLHVNKFLYRRGGAEGYLLDLAELQRGRGDTVAYFGMAHPDNLPGLPYTSSFPAYREFEPVPAGGRARTATAARMLWSTSARSGMADVLKAFRPDIVHLHNIYHQLSPSILAAAARAGVPCVMTLHDYKLACPSYQMLDHGAVCDACVDGGLRQAALRRCKDDSLAASALLSVESSLHRAIRAYSPVQSFISPSRFLAGVMQRAKVFPERMHVVRHFVDVAGTTAKVTAGGGLVFAGRLSREKGVDTLIEAVGGLADGATLDVAGDGPQRAELEALASAHAPGRVRFHGRLDKATLHDLLRLASVACVPSRWNENQPMAVLEAFGCGLPVVTTDLGGLPELIRPGVDGVVVPADDPWGLRRALADLLADPRRCLAMGAAGRHKVATEFTPERHMASLDHVYALAAQRRGARQPVPGITG